MDSVDVVSPKLFEIEQQTIAPIPASERHGRPRELAAIWFGMNMTPLTVVTGALATTLFGLSLWWALVAIVVGNVIGGIGMALHAAQGPTMGVPQMIQARGQFGVRGSALIVVVAMVMFVGFFASNLVVAGDALVAVDDGTDPTLVTWVATFASLVTALCGYRLVRFVTGISAYIVGVPLVLCLLVLVARHPDTITWGAGGFSTAGFFSMTAVGAVWQLAYAPYVSDYSRYMPAESGGKGAFWGTYLGCVSSTALLFTTGAILGLSAGGDNVMVAFVDLFGGFGKVVLVAFAVAAITGNSVNAYCSMLCALTLAENTRPGWIPGVRARMVTTVVLHVVGAAIAIGASADFLANYYNFVSVLLYVLIPWSAINLVDYYLVHHGSYEVDDFYRADGGRYGRWNLPALGVYVIAILAQLPFMVTTMYTGPFAEGLGYTDIAWVVGLVVAGGLYYPFARRAAGAATASAVRSGAAR
ncbi:NCS1 family nucleobase:cation symporter-1 [Nocardioides aromaticivorans]|uniref:NCS1 family nucleobase:cation symporter-1 n=1 Tax=Nocardioides aromaticivorans TaxID=200618 RepID=A0A7Y9ZE84_9ACTN|nr:cytosine permease [Nocardioides aromaticivorans]NYI42963.1 NCS1 family nucleobase:cation symporter-1 [Nocardioides aromaticivorans]